MRNYHAIRVIGAWVLVLGLTSACVAVTMKNARGIRAPHTPLDEYPLQRASVLELLRRGEVPLPQRFIYRCEYEVTNDECIIGGTSTVDDEFNAAYLIVRLTEHNKILVSEVQKAPRVKGIYVAAIRFDESNNLVFLGPDQLGLEPFVP